MSDCPTPIREIFISYSHDSPEHAEKVGAFATRLRTDGVAAIIDQWAQAPEEGWARWMLKRIQTAEWIVAVCTKTYCERFEGRSVPGLGDGVNWEGHLLTQTLYEAHTRNTRIVAVRFEGVEEEAIPLMLRAYTHYVIPSGYKDFYDLITNRLAAPPALGPLRSR